MGDISTVLKESIDSILDFRLKSDKTIHSIIESSIQGSIFYEDAYTYAEHLGNHLAHAFKKSLSSDVLPNGKMYYNIAQKVIAPPLENNYKMTAEIAAKVQQELNRQANIGLKAITPKIDRAKIDGFLNRLSNEANYDEIAWILDEPVKLLTLSAVDDCIRTNTDFQGKAGLTPKIVRKSENKCCEWCSRLEGEYEYPGVPKDVYRRHENCRCTVDYIPDGVKKQNIWSKQWSVTENDAKIEARKFIGLKINGATISSASEHVIEQMAARNVTGTDIVDAITHYLKVTEVKYDEWGRPSFTVIGSKATLAINPESGVATSTWRTHSKLAERLKNENKFK